MDHMVAVANRVEEEHKLEQEQELVPIQHQQMEVPNVQEALLLLKVKVVIQEDVLQVVKAIGIKSDGEVILHKLLMGYLQETVTITNPDLQPVEEGRNMNGGVVKTTKLKKIPAIFAGIFFYSSNAFIGSPAKALRVERYTAKIVTESKPINKRTSTENSVRNKLSGKNE